MDVFCSCCVRCVSGGVYVPCIYSHARWVLPQAFRICAVLWRLPCVLMLHKIVKCFWPMQSDKVKYHLCTCINNITKWVIRPFINIRWLAGCLEVELHGQGRLKAVCAGTVFEGAGAAHIQGMSPSGSVKLYPRQLYEKGAVAVVNSYIRYTAVSRADVSPVQFPPPPTPPLTSARSSSPFPPLTSARSSPLLLPLTSAQSSPPPPPPPRWRQPSLVPSLSLWCQPSPAPPPPPPRRWRQPSPVPSPLPLTSAQSSSLASAPSLWRQPSPVPAPSFWRQPSPVPTPSLWRQPSPVPTPSLWRQPSPVQSRCPRRISLVGLQGEHKVVPGFHVPPVNK